MIEQKPILIPSKAKYLTYRVGTGKGRMYIFHDPETLMLVTHGYIKFKWEQDCQGCQIEKECPCIGNPNNGEYAYIEEKIKSFR